MKMLEKAGDFALDIAKLSFGGVILSSIMAENLSKMTIYWFGISFVVFLTLLGFMFYNFSLRKEERK